jgi:serine phosphatase RsbU (regulator of sigma subunit)
MNIRTTLAILLSIFGMMLLLVIFFLGSATYRQYQYSIEQIIIDQARNDLLTAIIGLQNDQAQIAMIGSSAASSSARDDFLYQSADAMRRTSEALSDVGNAKLQELGAAIWREAAPLSLYANELTTVIASGNTDAIMAQSLAVIDRIDLAKQRLLKIRQAILSEVGITDTIIGGVYVIRSNLVTVNDALQLGRMLTLRELEAGAFMKPQTIRQIEDRARALQVTNRVYLDLVAIFDESIVGTVSGLSNFLQMTYLPAEAGLVRALDARQDVEAAKTAWLAAGDQASRLISGIQTSVFDWSQAYLALQRESALFALQSLIRLLVGFLVIFLLSLYIIQKHIVSPLEQLRLSVLDVVNGKLGQPGREKFWLEDIRTIFDALRVFRVTAIRRERLTRKQLLLHAQIAEAHRSLQSDMDAAAKVQLAQMPPPGDVDQIRFSTFFAPANVLAGDTFDYFALSEGRVGLLQVDVAGHGAAAGLVSVAAHLGSRRALRSLNPEGSLADAVERLNEYWSPEMTYFTLVAVQFDIKDGRGRMVQAGHPHPVLMRRDGSITRLGDGGLPIGVMPDAEFEEVDFPFEFGDKLFVFSDGICENSNEDLEIYTEERFIQFLTDNAACSTEELLHKVREMLDAWSGVGNLSDDVSLVVAERF